MKQLIYCTSLLCSFLLLDACQEQVKPIAKASALWNGEEWQADKVTVSVNPDCNKGLLSINLERTRKGTYLVESLLIFRVPLKVGRYPIHLITQANYCVDSVVHSSIHTIVDEDQFKDNLPTTNLPGDYVNISAYDPGSGRIEGDFAGVYIIRKGDKPLTLTDTVRVTKGVFSAQVQR
jgi:hypothetical protein